MVIPSSPTRRRPRVLLSAYACSPERGSESAVGWNRAIQSARYFDTWVICERHWCEAAVGRHLRGNGKTPGLHFEFLPLGAWERRIARAKIPGAWYLAYNLWQRRAYRVARRLHHRIGFDLVHHLTCCGFREPGYLWKLHVPFVWGPVGGTQDYPWRFLPAAGVCGAISEATRTVLNNLQLRYSPRVRRAAQKAVVLLAANSTNQRHMARVRETEVLRMLDVGTEQVIEPPPRDSQSRPFRVLWVGLFNHAKALHLLIDALGGVPASDPYELRVVGRGPLEARWRRLARRRGVWAHSRWLGWLPREEVFRQYDWADVLVFSSLRDTCGTVVIEALSRGVPVIGFNHQGVGDVLTDQCGVRIPVTRPQQAVVDLRRAIIGLQGDPARLRRMRHAALARAREYLWSRQGQQMAAIYRRVLEGDGDLGSHDRVLDGDCHVREAPAIVGDGACARASGVGEQDGLTSCVPVILSAAKDLAAKDLAAKDLVGQKPRFFASLRMPRYPYPERGT